MMCIALVAIVFKFLHFPGASILLCLSLGILSILYYPLGFALLNNLKFRHLFKKESYKATTVKRIIGGAGAGIAFSFSVIGVLFKFQSWPGAIIMLYGGLLGVIMITSVSIVKRIKHADIYYSNILKRALLYGTFCIFLLCISNRTFMTWKYPNNPEYVNALLAAQASNNDQVLWDKVEEEREKMMNENN